MAKFFYWSVIFFLPIFYSCESESINEKLGDVNELLSETDSSICILQKNTHREVCTVYYDKKLNRIKSINHYNYVGNKKTWVKGMKFYPEGHIDSLFITQNGLFTITNRYTPQGEFYEKSEQFLRSGIINQYWYYKDNGNLMDEFGCFHEILINSVNKKQLNFQILKVHEPNCIGDLRIDLHIGNYDDNFKKITDSTGFQILADIKLMDTISIEISNTKKELRYILQIQCKEYVSHEKNNYKNVTIPIAGTLTWGGGDVPD